MSGSRLTAQLQCIRRAPTSPQTRLPARHSSCSRWLTTSIEQREPLQCFEYFQLRRLIDWIQLCNADSRALNC